MAENSTLRLARFAADLRYDAIPADVVRHVELCLLDTVGCGLFGSTLPWSRILLDTLEEVDTAREAAVWGGVRRLGAPHAALANGAAVHAFELDDLHSRSIVHPGSVVVPAALAVAEHRGGVSGCDFVAAMVAGYEVAARVGMSVGAAHLLAGWHPTGTHGAIGAAAAAGSVLGLDAEQMRDALGIAGSQAGGLMAAQYGSMVKRFHAGRAAQSGVYGALLAARGYTGMSDLFESDYGGYCTTFSPTHDASALTADLGMVWETAAVGFKPYSTNGSCHPTIDALLDLRRSVGLTAADVERVDIYCSSATKEHVGWAYEPDSVTTAQMNLPYIVSAVLTDGAAFVDQFAEDRIAAAELVELSRRVQVHADADIDARGDAARHATRIEVRRSDGTKLTEQREFARGSAKLPMSADQVAEKFEAMAVKAVDDGRVEQLGNLVDRLHQLAGVEELAEALQSAGVHEGSTR